jgi:hypothetical protein
MTKTKTNQPVDLVGKRHRSGAQHLSMHEKSKEPYQVEEKIRKKHKRHSIFTKPKKFCTCTGVQKCSMPKKPKKM